MFDVELADKMVPPDMLSAMLEMDDAVVSTIFDVVAVAWTPARRVTPREVTA